MKSVIKICEIKTSNDISNIQNAIASNEGVIACEVSLKRKEVQVIYDENFVNIDKIIDSVEKNGYVVM